MSKENPIRHSKTPDKAELHDNKVKKGFPIGCYVWLSKDSPTVFGRVFEYSKQYLSSFEGYAITEVRVDNVNHIIGPPEVSEDLMNQELWPVSRI